MHQRKARFEQLADGFIALPGGFGTVEEVIELLTWNQLGLVRKPVVLLDVERFWGPLFDWMDAAVAAGFVRSSHRMLAQRAHTVDEALALALAPAPETPGQVDRPRHRSDPGHQRSRGRRRAPERDQPGRAARATSAVHHSITSAAAAIIGAGHRRECVLVARTDGQGGSDGRRAGRRRATRSPYSPAPRFDTTSPVNAVACSRSAPRAHHSNNEGSNRRSGDAVTASRSCAASGCQYACRLSTTKRTLASTSTYTPSRSTVGPRTVTP